MAKKKVQITREDGVKQGYHVGSDIEPPEAAPNVPSLPVSADDLGSDDGRSPSEIAYAKYKKQGWFRGPKKLKASSQQDFDTALAEAKANPEKPYRILLDVFVRRWDDDYVTLDEGVPANAQVHVHGRTKLQVSQPGYVHAHDNAVVKASGTATVVGSGEANIAAGQDARVIATDRATVDATGNAKVRADGEAWVYARRQAHVEASGDSRITLEHTATCVVRGRGRVDATNKAEVTAYDDSYVSLAWGSVGKAYGNAEVFTVGCKVEAFENARVDARGDAVVIAHDNASVDARDRTAVHAKGSGKITLKGDAFLADPA